MKTFALRTLTVALTLVLLAGANGGELASAATAPAQPDQHDCGCSDGCSCRGPVMGCNCSRQGVSLKTTCECGCSDGRHAIAGSWLKSLEARSCDLGAPMLIWAPICDRAGLREPSLDFEHEHPPRFFSPIP